jgi:hypothetical protein
LDDRRRLAAAGKVIDGASGASFGSSYLVLLSKRRAGARKAVDHAASISLDRGVFMVIR